MTHSLRLEAGLVLNVAGTLDVQSGGLIDLNSKGLRGGNNGSLFGLNGEAYNTSGAIVSGAGYVSPYSAGGSYGGSGGYGGGATTNAPYGLLELPQWLGSGGGALSGTAGHGGGRATITAGTMIVNGSVRANGGN
ncbi:MAG: hypothetical protein IPH09_11690 [bacterium]|nr:hypothetical protein [bacterium]